ncbi:MAG: 4'-phosphopantetheinyl transferase superfamily protein [Lachnospiraceae bacterium]|nr:4'-phosphopantetheinyl transferase superfamily protein [Lachnospiraceae bacterium]
MLNVYSLKVDELIGLEKNSDLAVRIDSKLDSERLKIVNRMTSNSSGCATARGAGLLLQYVGQKFMDWQMNPEILTTADEPVELTVKTVHEILDCLGERIDFQYRHGPEGKPYWAKTGMPFFNVSHSAGIVMIAVSDVEIGIDIQRIKGKNELNMARRFYSENEANLVENDCEIFYKLWARKEALGKRTGQGVRPYLNVDLSDADSEYMKQFTWNELKIEDYYICICR